MARRKPNGHDWYKDAVIYAVDVETFADGNGDGIGDFPGLTSRLDYLVELGVTCLWLLPFFESPNGDNGYDIADYLAIDPRFGSIEDFKIFSDAAHERNLCVLLDLVIQHTSNEHPWFLEAKSDRSSRYRDYYVWADEPIDSPKVKPIFPDVEPTVWTRDDDAGASYLHQFYHFEPDLNVNNPAVEREARTIVAHWCKDWADGFRADAASHMLGDEAISPEPGRQPHHFLRRLRSFLDEHGPGRVLLGEADVDPDELLPFFGRNDELQMLYNFYLNNYLFLAFATETAEPIVRAYNALPPLPSGGQWANFLRNLDELDLEQLKPEEKEAVLERFAPEKKMRAYNRGIRRRLAPMFDGDGRRLRMAHSILLTLPGSPVIPYGDEIGLGGDLSLPERRSVRTAMQWTSGAGGGFSGGASNGSQVPIVHAGNFGYRVINVADQIDNEDSLLCWLTSAIRLRKTLPELGRGNFDGLDAGNERVLAHATRGEQLSTIALHNLSGAPQPIELRLPPDSKRRLEPILRDDSDLAIDASGVRGSLTPYGYCWLRETD